MHARVLEHLLSASAVMSGAVVVNYKVLIMKFPVFTSRERVTWKCSFRETEPRMGCILMVVFNEYPLIP